MYTHTSTSGTPPSRSRTEAVRDFPRGGPDQGATRDAGNSPRSLSLHITGKREESERMGEENPRKSPKGWLKARCGGDHTIPAPCHSWAMWQSCRAWHAYYVTAVRVRPCGGGGPGGREVRQRQVVLAGVACV